MPDPTMTTMTRTIEFHRDELIALWWYIGMLEDTAQIPAEELGLYPGEAKDAREAVAKIDQAVGRE